ncbi:hybrid sensor histidine kinase/response regulator transcription factor [Flavivirga algicola]|uniref:histidine kinase n=1 Tax=Flavivirga algicola TaxID=2729136 RepID=A0ABX1S011_9FLAO|nr:two-component regulator propeller domain-containing protein [Flavivirga algicola]NMH88378.1 response regulator [Flavivirga algicola]
MSNLLVGQAIHKTSNDLKFEHFSSKEGLSQRSVTSIFQDKKGYLWFGTRDGLNKFDGKSFVQYRHNSQDSTSLSYSWISSIYEDTMGNLWVGTKQGLNKYNPIGDNFIRYKYSLNENTISDNEIWDITQLDDDFIWVATNDGINKIEIKTNKISYLKHESNNVNSISDNRVRSFFSSEENEFWICNIESVDVYNAQNKSFRQYDYPKGTITNAHVNNSPSIFIDSNQNVWLGYEGGLAILDKASNAFVNYHLNASRIIDKPVRSISEDNFGNIWIGSYNGLYILNRKAGTLKHYVHDENNDKSLSQNSIYKILIDSNGGVWIGTWAGGINFFDKDHDNFKSVSSSLNNKGLNYKVISSIVEGTDKKIWIGTEGGGINLYDKRTGKVEYFMSDPANRFSLSSNNIKHISKGSNDNLWIGTHDGGVNYVNPNLRPLKFYNLEDKSPKGINLKDYKITTMMEDSNKNLWIGTLTAGVIFYNSKEASLTRFKSPIKSVIFIKQSDNPNVLLFGGAGGIGNIDINSKIIKLVDFNNTKSEYGFPIQANCIYKDENDNYWIGTEGKGLYRYSLKLNKSEHFGTNEGLPSEIIYGILPDKNDNLWISTNNGLSKFDVKKLAFRNFYVSEGLQSNEFNYGAFLKTSSGELMFGGVNGLNYFNPNNIIDEDFIPNLDIYSVSVRNKPFLRITDSIKEIKLKYDQNDFKFDFVAINFSNPDSNNYAYMLEGFDADWNFIGNNTSANYTNLSHGTYVFKVKNSIDPNSWSEPNEIKVIILPAPWKTWWAYLIYLSLGALLFYFIRKLIKARIIARNELKRERLEKEQIEEVNKLKLQLFTEISHEFRTPLTLILGPVEQLLKSNIEEENPEYKRKLDTIKINTNVLLQLTSELLDFRKSESGKARLFASKNNIVPFIQQTKLSFDELAQQKNIDFQFISEKDTIKVWFDDSKLRKILFNLLSNAFKYSSENQKIIVRTSVTSKKHSLDSNKAVKIDIINFDNVIPKEKINLIFDRFYRLDHKNLYTGSGLGLSLTKRLVELHKGEIVVKSSKKDGTCFSVYLPLGKGHLLKNERLESTDINEEMQIVSGAPFVKQELLKISLESETNIEPIDKSRETILIVEDNTEVRSYIKSIFSKNYNIFEAANGQEAIEMAQKEEVDVIVSDVMMPIMDGFELCHKVKSEIITSHIPVVLLTAKTSDQYKKTGYKIGADIYITKPFDVDVLKLRIFNLLENRKNIISKFKKDIILEPEALNITSEDEKFLQKAIKIVENNITNPDFNVSVFTSLMGMSRPVLYRKLKALVDQSVSEFIRGIRLKIAKQMLIETKMNVSQIAYEVGFNDLKYFRKCFKELFNETPTVTRNRHLEKTIEP